MFITVLVVTVIACAGLALDGARVLGARRDCELAAASAARAATQWYDEAALRNGTTGIDTPNAITLGTEVLTKQGYEPTDFTITTTNNGVTITVRQHIRLLLLGLGGYRTTTVTGSAQSRIVIGL